MKWATENLQTRNSAMGIHAIENEKQIKTKQKISSCVDLIK